MSQGQTVPPRPHCILAIRNTVHLDLIKCYVKLSLIIFIIIVTIIIISL
jgi:hypothetical protein